MALYSHDSTAAGPLIPVVPSGCQIGRCRVCAPSLTWGQILRDDPNGRNRVFMGSLLELLGVCWPERTIYTLSIIGSTAWAEHSTSPGVDKNTVVICFQEIRPLGIASRMMTRVERRCESVQYVCYSIHDVEIRKATSSATVW